MYNLITLTRLLLEGVEPKKLDKLGKTFGFPVGPVTLTDEVGIDVGAHIGEYLTNCFGERFSGANPEVLRSFVNAGITGKFVVANEIDISELCAILVYRA